MKQKTRTVVAGALGECVHVAGVTNFLRLAESAGWRTVFLGPAISMEEMIAAAKREQADVVGNTIKAVDKVIDTKKASNRLDKYWEAAQRFAKGGKCSFSEDTQVTTQEGSESISAIEIGDYVLAWNEADGMFGYYEVTATWSHADEVLTELIIDGEWIETTPEHPFYVEGKGWTPAEDLEVGDQVKQADGTTGTVWLRWNIHKTQEMYNLTVDTAHTYFVGEGQWLVHNDCGEKFITLYHGSIDNATNILKKGFDTNRPGATYVTDSLEAARDAINYRIKNFPHEVTDPGIISSQIPRSALTALDNGKDILSRSYRGFYPYTLNATEYLLRSSKAKKFFNSGVRTLIR